MLSCHVFTCIRMQRDHSTLVRFPFWLLWHVLVPIFITAHPNRQQHHCMKSVSQRLLYAIRLAWTIFKFQIWMCWIVCASKACCSCYDRGAPVCVLLHICYTSQTTPFDADLDKWCAINTLHHGWCLTRSYRPLQGDWNEAHVDNFFRYAQLVKSHCDLVRNVNTNHGSS